MYSAKSVRLPDARWPSMLMCFSSRCQPRGRTTIVASSSSGRSWYCLPSSLVKSISRSSASLRLSWPPIMLSHSGVLASSKSASQTLAPELSALIVIFLSVGPVISTRRSTSPGAGAATRQDRSSRMLLVCARKSSVPPSASARCRSCRASSSSARRGPSSRCRAAIRPSASSVRISSYLGPARPVICTPSISVTLCTSRVVASILETRAASRKPRPSAVPPHPQPGAWRGSRGSGAGAAGPAPDTPGTYRAARLLIR